MEQEIIFNTDAQAATIYVMTVYRTTAQQVWHHFTEAALLEKWWLPKPWKASTIAMDFRAGGSWNYAVADSNGKESEGILRYHEINEGRSFDFTDEVVGANNSPAPNWLVGFTGVEEGMKLTINLHCNSEEELQKMLALGFEKRLKDSLRQLGSILNEESKVKSIPRQ